MTASELLDLLLKLGVPGDCPIWVIDPCMGGLHLRPDHIRFYKTNGSFPNGQLFIGPTEEEMNAT